MIELPENCRQRLAIQGKSYPKSNCAVCGQFSPRWKECDAALAAAPVPPAGDVEVPTLATVDKFGSLVRTGEVLRSLELVDRAHVTRLTAELHNTRLYSNETAALLELMQESNKRLTAERDGLLAEVKRLTTCETCHGSKWVPEPFSIRENSLPCPDCSEVQALQFELTMARELLA